MMRVKLFILCREW